MKKFAKSFSLLRASPSDARESKASTDVAGRSTAQPEAPALRHQQQLHGYMDSQGHLVDLTKPSRPQTAVRPAASEARLGGLIIAGGLTVTPGTLSPASQLSPDTQQATARSARSMGGGSLREYEMQQQFSDVQRASYARHHLEQCAVCQEPFSQKGPRIPKLAPCLHSICKQCISSLPGHKCPLDLLPIQIEEGKNATADLLHTNWIVLGSIDLASLQEGKPRQCDLCDDVTFCSVFLCLVMSMQQSTCFCFNMFLHR